MYDEMLYSFRNCSYAYCAFPPQHSTLTSTTLYSFPSYSKHHPPLLHTNITPCYFSHLYFIDTWVFYCGKISILTTSPVNTFSLFY